MSSTESVESLIQKLLYLESEVTYTVKTKEKQINLNCAKFFKGFLKCFLKYFFNLVPESPPPKKTLAFGQVTKVFKLVFQIISLKKKRKS